MRNLLVLLTLFSISLPLTASFYASEKLGRINLSHTEEGFVVHKDGKSNLVESHNMDSILRKMNDEQRAKFMEKGSFLINQTQDGDYTLQVAMKLKGGGPVTAAAVYWTTKAFCYAGLGGLFVVGSASAVAVATSVAASAAATGVVAAPISAAIASSSSTMMTSVALSTAGSGATVMTAATTAAAAAAVGIEAVSATAAAGALLIPFLP